VTVSEDNRDNFERDRARALHRVMVSSRMATMSAACNVSSSMVQRPEASLAEQRTPSSFEIDLRMLATPTLFAHHGFDTAMQASGPEANWRS
jgi:hypothetical protein